MPRANLFFSNDCTLSSSRPAFPDLFFWQITETEAELEQWLDYNPALIREAHERFRSEQRRKEWLTARILLACAMGPASSLSYLPSGKPFLTGDTTHHVSISHTADHVCLAISRHNIGVDIERISPRAFYLRERFLTPPEMEQLLPEKEDEGRGNAFFHLSPEKRAVLLWSAKEAAYKFFDKNNQGMFRDIRLEISPDGLRAIFCEKESARIVYSLSPHIVLACCKADVPGE